MSTGIVKANEKKTPTCDQVLEACNLYVDDLENYNQKLYRQLKKKNERISELENGYLGIPWYWYVIGGIAVGYGASQL